MKLFFLFFLIVPFYLTAASLSPEEVASFNKARGNKRALLEHDSDFFLIAAQKGHLFWVQELLKRGVPIDVTDISGRTALLWAAQMGHFEVVSFLVANGASLIARDHKGQNLLAKAAISGNKALFDWVVQLMPVPMLDITDSQGHTPLMLSLLSSRLALAESIVSQYSFDPYKKDINGKNALDIVFAKTNPLPFLKMFLAYGLFQTEIKDIKRLQTAYLQRNVPLIDFLRHLHSSPDHSMADSIGRQDCLPKALKKMDFSSRFEGVRDQRDYGLCWSFSSLALLEEQYFLKRGEKTTFSVPYFLSVVRPDLVQDRCQNGRHGDDSHTKLIQWVERSRRAVFDHVYSYELFQKNMAPDLSPIETLPPSQYYEFYPLKVRHVGPFSEKDSLAKRMRSLHSIFSLKGVSALISLKSAERAISLDEEASDGVSSHAIVVIGVRWNEKENRCELKVRNSWGGSDALHGYVPAYKILLEARNFSYLEEVDTLE